MRVLIALVALGGCYDPSIADCQFRCGIGRDCPDGTTCMDGFCRTATGTCPGNTGDANDACPGAPPRPGGCSTMFALENGGCGVLCGVTERSSSAAGTACQSAGWQFAILDTLAKLDAVPSINDVHWVGAVRPALSFHWVNGSPVIPEAWAGGSEPGATSGNNCAMITPARRLENTKNCGDTEDYICTWPVR